MIFYKLKEKINNTPIEIKASFAYMFSNVLQKCLSFFTLPIFVSLLTTNEYGECTIYQTWVSILSIFITLNLAYGSFSTAMIKFENSRDEYVSSIQTIFIILASVFLFLFIVFDGFFTNLFDLPLKLLVFMLLEIVSQNTILIWTAKKRFEYKYKEIIFISLLNSFLSIIVALVFVNNFEQKGYARIVGYGIPTILIGLIVFIINIVKGKKIYNKKYWEYALKFNIPLLSYYLSQIVFNQSDKIIIERLTNKNDVAMYGIAYNLAMILTFVLNSINNSYVPWLYERIKKREEQKNKSVSINIAIVLCLMLLCVIWYAPELIEIIADERYESAKFAVAPIAISMLLLFYSQLFINVEFFFEDRTSLIKSSILAAIVNIILNYLFIPIYGYIAASYTTLFSYIVFTVSNYLVVSNEYIKTNKLTQLYDIKMLFIIFVFFVIISFLGVKLYQKFTIRLIVTIMVLILLLLNIRKSKKK